MVESLAIISGKGGSGKTTLAISLAQLLASCEKRVLLVDCDLSTHGATYFFEGLLSEKNKYYTFREIMYDDTNTLFTQNTKGLLQVAPKIWFVPSRTDFLSKTKSDGIINDRNFKLASVFLNKEGYDIVIYDCQAGYSVATEAVLKLSKTNLAVIEADAISASSLRVLYSQLSTQLDSGATYQVFNKITKEERDIYSKLTHGTLFTNLSPILFDWDVRKAFVTNDLPNIDSSNPLLTNSIYTLAIVLFPKCKEDLHRFIIGIKESVVDTLNSKITTVEYEKKKIFYKSVLNGLLIFSVCVLGVFVAIFPKLFVNIDTFVLYIVQLVLLFFIIIIFVIIYFLIKHKDTNSQERRFKLDREREELKKQISQLKGKLKE